LHGAIVGHRRDECFRSNTWFETVSAALAPTLVPGEQRSEAIRTWQSACTMHIADKTYPGKTEAGLGKDWHLNHPDTDLEDSRGNSI
jgi:hypothetical protein